MLTLRVRVNLGVMVMEYSTFLKLQKWSLTIQWFRVTNTPGQGEPGSNGNGVLHIPQAPEVEPHYPMVSCYWVSEPAKATYK